MKAYFELERLVFEVEKHLNKDVLLLLVSDHGFKLTPEGPEHDTTAFYSFNKDIGTCPKRITDFASIIIEHLKDESRDDKRELFIKITSH